MSDVFFDDFGIPEPDVNLEIGSGSHGLQTGLMLQALEPAIEDSAPDWVLVYGDTNSTLAAALAAVKIGTRVAHLEAGLRSFNRTMPEEHNRILTDHSADLLLAPTQLAVDNLAREGLADKTRLVGDVMATSACRWRRLSGWCPRRTSNSPTATSCWRRCIALQHRRPGTAAADHRRPGREPGARSSPPTPAGG